MNVHDPNLFVKVAKSILNSVADALAQCNSDVPDCEFVGFARPVEDHCPDLVAWLNNVRPWDGNSMDSGLREGYLLCFNAYAFDVTIRLGRCYIDFGDDGNTLDKATIEDWSNSLYRDGQIMYIGWVSRFKAGQVTELGDCDPISIGPLIDYKEGGCAGWEFTITVGVM